MLFPALWVVGLPTNPAVGGSVASLVMPLRIIENACVPPVNVPS